MKAYCAHCLKPFEAKFDAQKFCTEEHRSAYHVAVKKHQEHVKKVARENALSESLGHTGIHPNSDEYISPEDN